MPDGLIGFGKVIPLFKTVKSPFINRYSFVWYFLFFVASMAFSACNNQTSSDGETAQSSFDSTEKAEIVNPSDKIPLTIELPSGEKLSTYEGSMEAMLLMFIQDPNTQPGKDNWFNFNNLNFEFGTDKILPESISELENITRILKAYPNVKIKIGGYTDKLEDEATNLKISTKRAKAVFEALKQQGVGSQLEGAEGYGSQFAQYSATASEEDRKKDRRISISVRAK